MRFTLAIETGTECTRSGQRITVAHMLVDASRGLLAGRDDGAVYDINGSPVGRYQLDHEQEE